MKPTTYQLANGQVKATFKSVDEVISHNDINTPHDEELPCKLTIFEWREKQMFDLIANYKKNMNLIKNM